MFCLVTEDSESPARKKSVKYSIPDEVKKNIKADVKNAKLWEEAMESVGDGVQVGHDVHTLYFVVVNELQLDVYCLLCFHSNQFSMQ